ncbi:MAG: hypothetical protein Q7K45_03630 [Nanoarchaeota archaeon]|nr:hypothetical protein [Nanoarchaeota archaeon]
MPPVTGKILGVQRKAAKRSEHGTGPLRNTVCFWCMKGYSSLQHRRTESFLCARNP